MSNAQEQTLLLQYMHPDCDLRLETLKMEDKEKKNKSSLELMRWKVGELKKKVKICHSGWRIYFITFFRGWYSTSVSEIV